MKVVIIKYNGGNICSVDFALQRLGITPIVTDCKEEILSADKVIFPGVGHAATTMSYLRAEGLDRLISCLNQPVLGICLGMQLMCASSQEGDTDCLGIFDVPVKKFTSPDTSFKIPHMGWNSLHDLKSDLIKGVFEDDFVYFVHSYYVPLCPNTIAACNYINTFSAALHKDNFYATQFHPEKSGQTGELILRNFLNL